MNRRFAVAGLVTAIAAGALAPTAGADHHDMSIREVFPGNGAQPNADYIELQMYSPGQTNLNGHTITICTPGGVCPPPTALPAPGALSGDNQRTILITGAGFAAAFPGVTADYPATLIDPIEPAGGAVCFNAVPTPDCVAWGLFPGNIAVTGAAPPFAVSILDGASIERIITPGCATLLEASDDTNNSSVDFAMNGAPVPRPNSVAPTETACAGGGGGGDVDTEIDKGPKKKIKSKKATFRFSGPDGATFECKFDKKAYKPCSSPHTVKKLKKGKHTFRVRAILNGVTDGSPDAHRFTVKKS